MLSFAASETLADSLPTRRSARTPLRAEQEIGTASSVARGRARVERLCLRGGRPTRFGAVLQPSSPRPASVAHALSLRARQRAAAGVTSKRPRPAGHQILAATRCRPSRINGDRRARSACLDSLMPAIPQLPHGPVTILQPGSQLAEHAHLPRRHVYAADTPLYKGDS
jgi:hypothetical protein